MKKVKVADVCLLLSKETVELIVQKELNAYWSVEDPDLKGDWGANHETVNLLVAGGQPLLSELLSHLWIWFWRIGSGIILVSRLEDVVKIIQIKIRIHTSRLCLHLVLNIGIDVTLL